MVCKLLTYGKIFFAYSITLGIFGIIFIIILGTIFLLGYYIHLAITDFEKFKEKIKEILKEN